jgi:hypothetical protein
VGSAVVTPTFGGKIQIREEKSTKSSNLISKLIGISRKNIKFSLIVKDCQCLLKVFNRILVN